MAELILDPQPVQRKFLESQERIVFFGGGAGGGKTWSILADNLQGVHDPAYFSAFFRTTTVEIDKGLWPEAKLMYEPILKDKDGKYMGKAHINEQTKTITFPSGSRSVFTYLELDKHADQWYGSEITKIYFDEFQFRTEYQFDILRSRNRSRANVTKGIRCTLNPDANHFVYDWVKPYLDEEGFPILEYSGRTRYYLIVLGDLHTDWDYDALYNKFYEPSKPDDEQKRPQTYTYIPATLTDNKVLMEMDPEYKANLDSMPEKKRKQLLLGCWAKDEDSGLYFNRKWLHKATHVPIGSKYARGWDTASEVPNENNKYPDFTASVKMAKSQEGNYYICGGHRFQKRPGERDAEIITTGQRDGVDCTLVQAIDPGAAGKVQYREFAKKGSNNGLVVRADPMPNNKSKLKRFEPFSSACQNGLVYIVESTFEPEQLKQFYKECEEFDGERSTARRKDDFPDSAATVFNFLAKEQVIDCAGLADALAINSKSQPNQFKDVSSIYGVNHRR